jgi:hypothetical protein
VIRTILLDEFFGEGIDSWDISLNDINLTIYRKYMWPIAHSVRIASFLHTDWLIQFNIELYRQSDSSFTKTQ